MILYYNYIIVYYSVIFNNIKNYVPKNLLKMFDFFSVNKLCVECLSDS